MSSLFFIHACCELQIIALYETGSAVQKLWPLLPACAGIEEKDRKNFHPLLFPSFSIDLVSCVTLRASKHSHPILSICRDVAIFLELRFDMVPYLRNVLWRVSCHKWLSHKKREPLCSPDCYGILILNLFTCCRAAAAVWGSYGLVSCLKVTSQLFVTAICWNNFCSLFLFNCLTSIFVCSRVFIKLVPSMPFDHRRYAETLSMLLHQVSRQTTLLPKGGEAFYLKPL